MTSIIVKPIMEMLGKQNALFGCGSDLPTNLLISDNRPIKLCSSLLIIIHVHNIELFFMDVLYSTGNLVYFSYFVHVV